MAEWRGKPVADALTAGLMEQINHLKESGVSVKLAVVRVGEREEDLSYERGLSKRFMNAGAEVERVLFPTDVQQDEFENAVRKLDADPAIHGILIFRPLPAHLDEKKIIELISPRKDVDCMTDQNALSVYSGRKGGHAPCTPQAVIEMLEYYGYDLTGKKAVVVGRSAVVGKPLAMLLLAKNATVTICHTKTKELPSVCREADLLIACAGKARMIGSEFVRPGMTVIDVGINADGDGICGDVDYAAVCDIVDAITPVPGGVGSVTTSVLLKHTVESAEQA